MKIKKRESMTVPSEIGLHQVKSTRKAVNC